MTGDVFEGFPLAGLDFYEDLENDNSRTFWLAHKDVYESSVLRPAQLLAVELKAEFGDAKLFRPYRDVRFAKDKTPYKTQQGVWFEQSSRYFQISAPGLMVGGGRYYLSPDQLARYRRAVDNPVTAALLRAAIAAGVKGGLELGGERLSRVPSGFAKDHPEPELIRCKSITLRAELGAPAWLSTRRAKAEVVRRWRAAGPLVDWLDNHVGASEDVLDADRARTTGQAGGKRA